MTSEMIEASLISYDLFRMEMSVRELESAPYLTDEEINTIEQHVIRLHKVLRRQT